MKVHVDAGVNSGAVHGVTIIPANTAGIDELPELLREDHQVIFAGTGYASDEYKKAHDILDYCGLHCHCSQSHRVWTMNLTN